MLKKIEQLCREHTDLSGEEIAVIQMMAHTLQPLANLEAADIFVDCPCREGDAIVVAEANPEDMPSSYKSSLVGMLAIAENEPAVARTLELGIATRYMKAKKQEDKYTIQSVEPIKYNSRVIGVLIREKRITEDAEDVEGRYEAVETPLNHMINESDWLTESIDEGLILVDVNGLVTFRNMYAKKLFQNLGYVEDILGQKYKNICLIHYDEKNDLNEVISEVRISKHYLRIRQIQMEREDIRLAVIIRDITWNREQEKNLVLKSVAIKELHHRIKNNLQTIASLLRLQARRTDNEETKGVLNSSINRILAISVTHQLLAHSCMDEVNLKEVLRTVKNNVIQSFFIPGTKLELELNGDEIIVDSDIATSVALAVNELLQNAIKYAFEGRTEGSIEIQIKRGKVYSVIEIIDDGVGFDTKKIRTGSMGLNIVESVVRDKLHGRLKIRSDENGTRVFFDFLNKAPDLVTFSD